MFELLKEKLSSALNSIKAYFGRVVQYTKIALAFQFGTKQGLLIVALNVLICIIEGMSFIAAVTTVSIGLTIGLVLFVLIHAL